MPNFPIPIKNVILAHLPDEDYERLLPNFEVVALVQGTNLYNAREQVCYAYFPNYGFISLIFTSEDGTNVEVGMIGNEGMVGALSLFGGITSPYQTIVSISGSAIRIKMDLIKSEFNRFGFLHNLLLLYTEAVLLQSNLSTACNCFHTVKKRLCCWLLRASDRANTDVLNLTQEYLSYMIGTSRSEVAIFAKLLQQEELISYRRGEITILNKAGMEKAVCECYKIGKAELEKLLFNYSKVTGGGKAVGKGA